MLAVCGVGAQACHGSDLRPEAQTLPLRLSLVASFATYRNEVYAGEYQGYFAIASYSHPWVSAEAALGAYRIVRNGLARHGISDLALDVRATVARFTDDRLLGLELAATLPTADAQLGLGMGHVMLMPGAFFEYRNQQLRLLLQLGYGRVAGGGSGHAHQTGPIVNPMNRSEIEHTATLSYVFHAPLFAAVRLFGALPVGDAKGVSREVMGLGLGASFPHCQLTAELHLPLVGQPFQLKSQLAASFSF